MPRLVVIAAVLASEGLMALTALWIAGREALTLALQPSGTNTALGIAAGLASVAAIRWAMAGARDWQQRFRRNLLEIGGQLATNLTVVDLAFVALLAGLGEELLFRVALFDWLEGFAGGGWALAGTSLLFGLVHPVSRVYVLYAALVGALLGAMTMATGTVWAAVVAHAVIDFAGLLLIRPEIANRKSQIVNRNS